MVLNLNGKRIIATKTNRPLFSSHRGRTWDSVTWVLDGKATNVYYDSSWGMYGYFQHPNTHHWYKLSLCQKDIDVLESYKPIVSVINGKK